jgi:hypothetical protein
MKPSSLWIFVDESGNPDVVNRYGKDLLATGQTSHYFVMAAVRTDDPTGLRRAMDGCIAWADARYGSGIGRGPVTALHARDDRSDLREHVERELALLPVKTMAVAMDERLLDPTKTWRTDRTKFYNEMAAYLLGDSLHVHAATSIVFSHKNHDGLADLQVMTKAVAKRWSAVLRKTGATPTRATATHLKCAQDPALYAADYVAWAVFRGFEIGDMVHMQRLQPVLSHVWDLARVTHHTRKNPMKNPP